MAYGEIKVDTVTFTDGGIDKSVSISGLVQNPTFSGNITVTGTISGNTVQGQTVSGVTVTGTTANFVSGVFTTQISGATITGNVGSFTTITGGTVTLTSGVFASGTAAAPSVSIGTTDNGLYSPGADQVAVATSGTGRLFVDASGNVGVGTSSVNALLEVNNSTAGGEVQRIEGNYDGSGSVTLTNWRRAGGSVAAALKYNDDSSPLCMSIGTTTSHEFRIRTADTDAITIDASQRVGIGTSAPQDTLQVGADSTSHISIANTGSTDVTSGIRWRYGGAGTVLSQIISAATGVGSNTYLSFHTSGTGERMRIDGTGRVGIGTASPSSLLHLSGNSGTAIFTLSDPVNGMTGKLAADPTTLSLGTTTNHAVLCYTNSVERVRIDSSGRLLVGTSSARSDFYNGSGNDARLQIEGNGSSSPGYMLQSWVVNHNSATVTPHLVIGKSRGSANGSVTVVQNGDSLGHLDWHGADGTNMVVAASIGASVDGTPGADDMPGRIVLSTTADGASSPTERLRITSAGLVGIGTSTPNVNYKVTIEGNSSAVGPGIAFSDTAASPNNYNIGINGSKNFFIDGPSAASFDFVLDSSGRVGIGTTSPSTTLSIGASASSSFNGGVCLNRGPSDYNFYEASDGTNSVIFGLDYTLTVAKIGSVNSYPIGFFTGNSERARIDTSGRLLVGTSSPYGEYVGASSLWISAFQVARNEFNGTAQFSNWSNNAGLDAYGGTQIFISRCRSGVVGTHTGGALSNGNPIGRLIFNTSDGTNFRSSAYITAEVDGEVSTADVPGRLVFSTTADGASSPTERLRITSAGLVGIGTTSPVTASAGYNGLTVNGSTGGTIYLQGGGTSSGRLVATSTDFYIGTVQAGGNLIFQHQDGSYERARIDSSGRLLVGTSTARTNYFPTTEALTPNVQLEASRGGLAILGTGNGSDLFIGKGSSVTAADDFLGEICFTGFDGTNNRTAARILCQTDAACGAGDMPGRLVFSTTADGASSPTERMRITSAGNVGIGTTSPSSLLELSGVANPQITLDGTTTTGQRGLIFAYNGTGYGQIGQNVSTGELRIRSGESGQSGYFINFSVNGSDAARIDSSGRLLVGTSSTSTSHLLKVAGPAQISWFACDTKSATVAPSTTSVLTISNISGGSVAMVKVYIRVYFAANGALNAFFDYDILTSDTGGSGGGAAIRETLNESGGSFQVATGDFAVTRSAGTVTITYTNQASGTNIIDWRVAGLFDTLSIA
jgi:hypothetical protein